MGQGRTLLNQFDNVAYYEAAGNIIEKRKRVHQPKQPAMLRGISYPLRAGVAVRKLPVGRNVYGFYSREAAERALKRADRWVRRYGDDPKAEPPRHIAENADLAARQLRRA